MVESSGRSSLTKRLRCLWLVRCRQRSASKDRDGTQRMWRKIREVEEKGAQIYEEC